MNDKCEEMANQYWKEIFQEEGCAPMKALFSAKQLADAYRFADDQREKEAVALEALDGELITASRAAEILGVSVSEIIKMRNKRVKDDDLTAAYMKGVEDGKERREKETCEWRRYEIPFGQSMSTTALPSRKLNPRWKTSCGRIAEAKLDTFCGNCGRRIVERGKE
jgi:predicted HTH domain antitoxin